MLRRRLGFTSFSFMCVSFLLLKLHFFTWVLFVRLGYEFRFSIVWLFNDTITNTTIFFLGLIQEVH